MEPFISLHNTQISYVSHFPKRGVLGPLPALNMLTMPHYYIPIPPTITTIVTLNE
uniref:Uncharacterized protein n=1 Tax=Ciona intestinalis TaxID=7719 RepID=H2XPL0_CIOIN